MKKVALALFLALFSSFAFAIPQLLSVQGSLSDGGSPVTGTKSMQFALWTAASGGTNVWSETQPSVSVSSGVFNALLGSVTALPAFDADYWLEISVEGTTLSPRARVASAGYAINADTLDSRDSSYFVDTSSTAQTKAGNLYVNGNVGIGTASPGHRLEITGTGVTTGLNVLKSGQSAPIGYDFTTTGVSYPRSLGLGILSGNSYAANIPVTQPGWNGGYGGYIGLWSDVNGGIEFGTNVAGVVSVLRGTGSGNAFGFYTNLANAGGGYTRWGVYSTGEQYDYFSGSVGIGTAIPSYKLDVAGSAHASSFPTSSDIRLKENITELSGVLGKLENIRAVSFDWNQNYKDMGRATGHREIGFIAQDIEKEFPEIVTTWGNESYRAVDYGRFTAILLEAVKEQQREIQQLQQQNAELKAEVSLLTEFEKRVDALEAGGKNG